MLKEKYKVSIDARMISHSGIGTYIKSVVPVLTEHFNLIILGSDEIIKSQTWAKKVHIINMNSPIYTMTEQFELYLKIPKCDLFLSPHYNIPLLPIKAKKRAVIIHDVNHLVFINQLSMLKKSYAKFMINAAVKKSDTVITISEFSKAEIIKYTNTKKNDINIVYFGIDKQKYQKQISKNQIDDLRKKYNLPDNYLLYVGSIKPHKNFSGMINSYTSVLESFPEKKLAVVGIKFNELKNERDSLYRIMNSKLKDNIIFTGYVEENDLAMIYNSATCLIFPSLYEGFGLPPLEAMLNNCPVVASNLASIPEVCDDAALYFNPKDIQDMADKIKTLLNNENLRINLVEKGRKNLDRFTLERFSNELTSVLLNTISSADDD